MAQQVGIVSPHGKALTERVLGPDLARGAMLLIIAIVHAHMLQQMAGGNGSDGGAGWHETAATALVVLLGENRGYPMFAALFGYGLMRIVTRHGEMAGADIPIARVRRRGFWLVGIGLLHTLLLSFGDILSVYGIIALALAGMLLWSDRRVLGLGLGFLALAVPLYALVITALTNTGLDAGEATAGFWLSMGMRLAAWPISTILFVLVSVFPFTIGVLAARRSIMDQPEHFKPMLRRMASWGIMLAALGGVPQVLVATDIWAPDMIFEVASLWLHVVTGYLGGLGYAALIALLASGVTDRRSAVVRALAATGQRSLSCYLLQSIAWFALFMPFTLDLAPSLNSSQAVLLGALVWLATVLWADMLGRQDQPGPAETFLRNRLHARVSRS